MPETTSVLHAAVAGEKVATWAKNRSSGVISGRRPVAHIFSRGCVCLESRSGTAAVYEELAVTLLHPSSLPQCSPLLWIPEFIYTVQIRHLIEKVSTVKRACFLHPSVDKGSVKLPYIYGDWIMLSDMSIKGRSSVLTQSLTMALTNIPAFSSQQPILITAKYKQTLAGRSVDQSCCFWLKHQHSSDSPCDYCSRMDLADTSAWTTYLRNNSLLQPLWDSLRLNYSDYLRSPLFPVVLTVSSYFIICLPYLICDIMGDRWAWVQQFKIQPSRRPSASTLLHCASVTLYNHVFLVFPASVAQWAWRPPVDLPERAPTLLELIAGVIGNLLLFDFQYFIWHLLHHRIRWLYVTFHAIHHNYSSPFALATQCLGGWELVTVGFWTTLNPMILRCHLLTTWAFMILHVYVSIEDHCGYDFPWSTSRVIPFGIYGGPSKHDVHHQKPNTNFAPHFSHWDKIFGTHADFSFCTPVK